MATIHFSGRSRPVAAAALLIVVDILLCFACRTREEDACVTIHFDCPETGMRSVLPAGMSVDTIALSCSGPGGASAEAGTTAGKALSLELMPGHWVLTAQGKNPSGIPIVAGRLELDLAPGATVEGSIALLPIQGLGSLELAWTLKGSLTGTLTVEGCLSGPGGEERAINAPFDTASLLIEALAAGSWGLELRLLADGQVVCGLADGILVAAGMRTSMTAGFEPPAASLALGLIAPDYRNSTLAIRPTTRRAVFGLELAFRTSGSGSPEWFLDGIGTSGNGSSTASELRLVPAGTSPKRRLDCVDRGMGPVPKSGSAMIRLSAGPSVGRLSWAASLAKADEKADSADYIRALGDCRDLDWSADSRELVVAGRNSNSLAFIEASSPGAAFLRSSISGTSGSPLASPGIVRRTSVGSVLALSETDGALYGLHAEGEKSGHPTSLIDAKLAGGKDMVITQDGRFAYIASSDADLVACVGLDATGMPTSIDVAAAKDAETLNVFSRPSCLALSPDSEELALGTTGDDAIYIFRRDKASGSLAFMTRMDKSSFPASAPLSDPNSLTYSPDGLSLFVLSYYGKAVIRLDRASRTASFAIVAGAKSGQNGIAGFSTPRRLALSPDGRTLAIAGSGSEDGLAVFGTGTAGELAFQGDILPTDADALPSRPSCLAFSPDGKWLAVGSDGWLCFYALGL